MWRGMIYGSYRKPRELVWIFGCAIFLTLMAEAFMGYLLPWGQMSYWGAQVIVNLFAAVPFIGPDLALLIRGDYVVSDATLSAVSQVEQAALEKDLRRHNDDLRKLVGRLGHNGTATDRIADLQDRIRSTEQRATQVREELIALGRQLVDEKEAARALTLFDPVWDSLSPREQVRVMQLLIERVDYDGEKGTVSVTFHPTGMGALADLSAATTAPAASKAERKEVAV
jgi:hypothetical protein